MNELMLKKIYEELEIGNSVCMVTLTEVKGSSPGKQGATMAFFKDETILGSVGGGMVEHCVINKCRECLLSGEDLNFEYSLNSESMEVTMNCGGYIKGYIKVFKPKPKILIIGAGHVGSALYKISKTLDFYSIIVDDRDEFANKQRFKDANEVYSGDIDKILQSINLNDNTYVVIATRGYEKDIEALRVIIDKNVSYIGMIGSKNKWRTLKSELLSEGVDENLLNLVYSPVGLNISSNDIDEIAFGIMAEILLVKNKGELSHRKDKK
ncbi:XdhC family protein [Paraclostridium sordellii]|uniref:XdhC family protein n=1 Tax=Paraclostridium sordellii TaxID=1505 RepID=UPI00070F0CEB|nr:XdhC/CoxI family protein [Paeniclostridium sordellii]